MNSATLTDTLNLAMGSGVTMYDWYRDVELALTGADSGDILTWNRATDWAATVTAWDPQTGEDTGATATHVIDHAKMMSAARKAIAKDNPFRLRAATRREFRNLVFDVDEVDMDADDVDLLLQIVMYGRIVFG